MHSTHASLSAKLLSTFFAMTLAFGLVPPAALATSDSLQPVPGGSEGVASTASSAEGGDTDVFSHYPSDDVSSVDGGDAAASSEDGSNIDDGQFAVARPSDLVSEDVALTPVLARAESVKSYFLAQTLESTRTIPIVCADLPLDADTTNFAIEPVEGEGGSDGSESIFGVIAAESTVIGSFAYLGMTFAVEPGGESVALVAADYSQLPEEFVEKQVVVIPDVVTVDGIDFYSVTRIANGTFSAFTRESAKSEFKGCEALFSDADLLAEAGIGAVGIEALLNSESDMVDIDGDGEVDAPANPLKDCTGILALGIPSSVTSIGDDAFAGSDTLQYLVVSEDNPIYASFDGVLYDADLATLWLIPEGRVGAVRIAPSMIRATQEVFSRCVLVDMVIVAQDSAGHESLTKAIEPANSGRFVVLFTSSSDEELQFAASYLSLLTKYADSAHHYAQDLDALKDQTPAEERFVNAVSLDMVARTLTFPSGASVSWTSNAQVHYFDETLDAYDPQIQYTLASGCFYSLTCTEPQFGVTSKVSGSSNVTVSSIPSGMRPIGHNTSTPLSGFQGVWGYNRVLFNTTLGFVARSPEGEAYSAGSTLLSSSNGYIRCSRALLIRDCKTGVTLKNKDGAQVSFSCPEPNLLIMIPPVYTIITAWDLQDGLWVGDTIGDSFDDSSAIRYMNSGLREGIDGAWSSTEFGSTGNPFLIPMNVKPPNEESVFYGWNEEKDALPGVDNGKWWYTADGLVSKKTSTEKSQKLYAIYQDSFCVDWDGRGGSGHIDKAMVPAGGDGSIGNKSLLDALAEGFDAVSDTWTVDDFKNFNVPAREGWKFEGWYADENCTDPLDYAKYSSFVTIDSANRNYYAKWRAEATWDANGGTLDGQPSDGNVYAESTSYVEGGENRACFVAPDAPAAPIGYMFAGWINTAEWRTGEILVQPGEAIYNHLIDDAARSGNPTFYACWRYRVILNLNTYDGNGRLVVKDGKFVAEIPGASYTGTEKATIDGVEVEVYTFTAIDGASIALPVATRIGYGNATKWDSEAHGGRKGLSGTLTAPFRPGDDLIEAHTDTDSFDGKALVLLADWSGLAKSWSVALDKNGGVDRDGSLFEVNGASSIASVMFDSPVLESGATLAAPQYKGYSFEGYFTEPDGKKDADGNPVLGTKYLEPDPDDATKMRATSALWTEAVSDGSPMTLYAHYIQRSFVISFSKESPRGGAETNEVRPFGNVAAIEGVNYGDKYNDLTYDRDAIVLSCDGYDFLGWSIKRDATAEDSKTMVFDGQGAGIGTFLREESLSLYPVWSPKIYNISWDRALPTGVTSEKWTTEQEYGAPLCLPNARGDANAPADAPECIGYAFSGWFCSVSDDDTDALVEGDVFRPTGIALLNLNPVYFAHWSVKRYQVTLMAGEKGFYSDRHQANLDESGAYVKAYNVATTSWKFQEPTPEAGYHFDKWLKLKDGVDPADADSSDASQWVTTSHTMISKDEKGFPDIYADTVYLATYRASADTVTLDLGGVEYSDGTIEYAPDSALDMQYSKTNPYSVEAPFTLPKTLTWTGHTFLGWYKTAPNDEAEEPESADPARMITVSVPEGENPRPVTYTACWVEDVYTVRFVEDTPAPYDDVDIADRLLLTRTDNLVLPTPAFRNAFPTNDRIEHYAVVFDDYLIEDADGNVYEYEVGQKVHLGELIDALKLRDEDGGPLRHGSTIRFFGRWIDTYHIDVTPVVNICFDPDRVDESLLAGEGWIRAVNSQQAGQFKVVSVLMDPVDAVGTLPGTAGAFATAAGSLLDDTFLTLAAYPEKDGTSASVKEPVEFNLGAMVGNGGSLASSHRLANDAATKELSEVGFTFGSAERNASEAERTLRLKFGLRFAMGANPRELTSLNSRTSYKDTNTAIPIANVFYTIAMQ